MNHVLKTLEGHYTRGYGDRSREAQITLLPGAIDQASAFLRDDTEARARLNRVAELIAGFETPYGMELLATVHWVATRESAAAATDPERAVEGVHNWSERKRKTFRAEHIRKAWHRLNEQGWLVPEVLEAPTPA